MKVTFGVYPDNLGHITSNGCVRCHDGRAASDGSKINDDCEYCHKQIEQPSRRQTLGRGRRLRGHALTSGIVATMIWTLLIAWCLLALTVTIHAAGLSTMLRGAQLESITAFWPMTRLLVWVAWWLLLLHLAEISVWALFYWYQKCLPDAESSFYFSGVTYTTLGYGDLVLPQEWRLFGPVEGLTGILMCGLSTGFFFAVVSRGSCQARSRQD